MAYTYKVVDKVADPSNGNIVITVEFSNPSIPGPPHVATTMANDLTDETIDDWARRVIGALETRDASITKITTGIAKVPADVSDERKALELAQVAFADALEQAQIAALNNPQLDAAYAALRAARDALSRAMTAGGKIGGGRA